MKLFYALPMLLLFLQVGFSQKFDSRIAETNFPLDQVELILMPPLDNGALLEAELERRAPGVAPRFAEVMNVEITPDTHGYWEELENDQAVWRLRILSEDAYSLNLGFTKYYMPEGGTLILYSPDRKHVMGPFTPADNEDHEQLWTPIFDGDALVIEVQLPQEKRNELQLALTAINHDFVGFSNMAAIVSGSCNLDVICGDADGWEIVDGYRDIIQSVAVIGTGGGTFCTGFLINNARQDCTPYFITAAHCGISAGNAASLVAYWNYQNSTCRQPNSPQSGGAGNGSLADFNTGSIFRAGYGPSDFTLVEFDDPVSATANAFFAGWDARDIPTSDTTICVHHPSTDEKRISFEFGTTYYGAWGSGATMVPDGNHLVVPDWDIGTTEGGSSGSPLFNKDKQVVGQLHGGAAACGNDAYDTYGRLFSSWDGGGTPTTRLRDWLDPDDSGVLTLDGRWEMACNFFVAPDVTFQQICSPDSAVFELLVSENFTAPVDINISGVPDGAEATLSANPANGGDTVILTISNTGASTPGSYTITIAGTDGVEGSEADVTLDIFAGAPATTTLQAPADAEEGTTIFPTYSWASLDFASTYDLQVANDADFTDLVIDMESIEGTTAQSIMLGVESTYYWRVRGSNLCGIGEWTAPFSFTTAAIACGPSVAVDIPQDISSVGTPTITSSIEVNFPGTAADIKVVNLNINHTWTGDLFVTLTSPQGTEIVLMDRPGVPNSGFGCNGDNVELTFDDFAANSADDLEGTCGDLPAIAGTFQPVDPLTSFAGEPVAGTWTLSITDNADQDGGSLEGWGLEICATIPSDAAIVLFSADEEICEGSDINGQLVLGTGFEGDVDLSIDGLPDGVSVNWSENPTFPGATVTFTTSGLIPSGNLALAATATDGTNNSTIDFNTTITPPPAAFNLTDPTDGASGQAQGLLLNWEASAGVESYNLTVATDPELMDVFVSPTLSTTTYNLSGLDLSTTYYWQIEAVNECGSTLSEVFSFSTFLDYTLGVTPDAATLCQSEEGVFTLSIGVDFGAELSFGMTSDPASTLGADFEIDPNDPNVATATLTNLDATMPGTYSLTFSIDDGTNSTTTDVALIVEGPPTFTTLLTPPDGSTIVEQSPTLDWSNVPEAVTYTIEIADSDLFTNIIETDVVNNTNYTVSNILPGGTYFWRITTNNECGSSVSAPFNFVVMPNSITELNGRSVDFQPNPTNALVNVIFSEVLSGDLVVEVFSVNGQQLQRLQFDHPSTNVEVNLGEYASGVYLIRLINEEASLSRRVILQK